MFTDQGKPAKCALIARGLSRRRRRDRWCHEGRSAGSCYLSFIVDKRIATDPYSMDFTA